MPVDPIPFADFLVARLLRPIGAKGAGRAFAETEHPINHDDWFWTDDNAKIIELLSVPKIWRRHNRAVSEAINFLTGMCQGPLIFRRLAAPKLEVLSQQSGLAEFRHSLLDISCDLPRGRVSIGMRFHDGRTARNATFGENSVRFRHAGQFHTVMVEPAINTFAIQPTAQGIQLSWTSEIVFQPRGHWRKTALGELTYRCDISRGSMFVDFEADLNIAPGLDVSDVTLSFCWTDLSHNRNEIRYEKAVALQANGESARAPDRPGMFEMPTSSARYWAVIQTSHMAGFAAAIHCLPQGDALVEGLAGARDGKGRLQSVGAHHSFPGPRSGRVTTSQKAIITSGGLYEEVGLYADILEEQAKSQLALPIDLSISYDYGAEMYAMARCLATLNGPQSPLTDKLAMPLRTRLEESFSRLARAYRDHFIEAAHHDLGALFSRSLAYVALAHAEMLRQGDPEGRHARNLRESCDWLIAFERINTGLDGEPQVAFVMGAKTDILPYVDCHAACLLALVRGSEGLDFIDWVSAIDGGLAAFCVETQILEGRKVDMVCVDYLDPQGVRHRTETLWNFKSGICLQLFSALRESEYPPLRALWKKHRARLEVFDAVLRARLNASIVEHEDGLEILTSLYSSETNSETQPWAALGLSG